MISVGDGRKVRFEGALDFLVCCFSRHLLALPAAAGTAAASAASAAAIVATTAKAVVKTRAAAEAAAEAADAAAVPAAAGKASKCPEKQQTKKSQTQLGLDPVLGALDSNFMIIGRTDLRMGVSGAKFDAEVDFEVHFTPAP